MDAGARYSRTLAAIEVREELLATASATTAGRPG